MLIDIYLAAVSGIEIIQAVQLMVQFVCIMVVGGAAGALFLHNTDTDGVPSYVIVGAEHPDGIVPLEADLNLEEEEEEEEFPNWVRRIWAMQMLEDEYARQEKRRGFLKIGIAKHMRAINEDITKQAAIRHECRVALKKVEENARTTFKEWDYHFLTA